MIEIKALENVDRNKNLKDQGIHGTLYWAYRKSRNTETEFLNFHDAIHESDMDLLTENLKTFGITEITISSTYSSLLDVVAAFIDRDWQLTAFQTVHAQYSNWQEYSDIPALKLCYQPRS